MPFREPNRHHRIGRALTAGALVAAVAFPSGSSAMPIIDPPARASAQSAPSGPGFQWDDAAIGAGAVLVLVGTGGAVAGGARRRRMRRALAS
jgi:membrane associated rhomboid family serine protease